MSLAPEIHESTPVDPYTFLSPADLSAIVQRCTIAEPSQYDLREAWNDRHDLVLYFVKPLLEKLEVLEQRLSMAYEGGWRP